MVSLVSWNQIVLRGRWELPTYQENYIRYVLNCYCGKDSEWGLPPMQTTPAPLDYVFSKSN